jgi:hypothetical protein
MTGSPLVGVRRFVVPAAVIDPTLDVLAGAGREGHEAFVVWGGTVQDGTLVFTSALVPEQTAHRTPDGLLVTVTGQALFAVNQEFWRRGELLAGQVHSHPTDAYHSDTDDCFPLATLLGALSVVVPDFARDGRDGIRSWAWYRLVGIGLWAELDRDDKVELRG